MIPLTFSIANGLAFGITAYALLRPLRDKIARTDWLLLVLSALFVARFVWLSARQFQAWPAIATEVDCLP